MSETVPPTPQTSPHEQVFCILSDGTGGTAESIIRAALLQYIGEAEHTRILRFKNIRQKNQVDHLIVKAKGMNAAIVHTLVTEELRNYVQTKSVEANVPAFDLMGPCLNFMSIVFHRKADSRPGVLHQVDDRYFQRIAAIEYTVKHDDGKLFDDLDKADIILVGISRTSKTPLSIFLSHKGYKVANIPLVSKLPLPQELFSVDQRKIVGLEIDPEALVDIRRNRIARMGNVDQEYASLKHVTEELDFAQSLFKRNRLWPVFNVTGKALEEIALEIENVILRNKHD